MTVNDVIYLDCMSSTPMDPVVLDAMIGVLRGDLGQAASKHLYGQRASTWVERARQQVALLIGGNPEEIIWTSGATESNNLALLGAAFFYQIKGRHIITCQTEHQSVLEPCRYLEQQGFEVSYLPVLPGGQVAVDVFERAIRRDTLLASIMHVNNETGLIQPIAQLGRLARERGVLFHVDAAQSAARLPIDLSDAWNWPVDLLTLSAHKLYGPKGIGVLYCRASPKVHLKPLLYGGGQERRLRPGTLATHQIVGMGMACERAKALIHVDHARYLEYSALISARFKAWGGIRCHGDPQHVVPGHFQFSVRGVHAEALHEDVKSDLALSSSSACLVDSHGSAESYVLKAMGVSQQDITQSLRMTAGRMTTQAELSQALDRLGLAIKRLRDLSPYQYQYQHQDDRLNEDCEEWTKTE